MMLDLQNILSDKQSLALAVGSYNSTNTIDLLATGSIPQGGAPISDPGRTSANGGPKLLVEANTAFTSGTSIGTVQAQLIMADDAALSVNVTVLEQTAAILVTALISGYQFRFGSIPVGMTQRYLGVRYVIAGEAITAGTVTAALILDRQTNPFL